MKITLVQMLDARERRAQRQRELLKAYLGHTLISFTMNIAGPVKNSPLIREGFLLGKDLLLGQLSARGFSVLFSEEIDEVTGNEALFVLDGASVDVKKMTVFLEDHTIAGRVLIWTFFLWMGKKSIAVLLDCPQENVCSVEKKPHFVHAAVLTPFLFSVKKPNGSF